MDGKCGGAWTGTGGGGWTGERGGAGRGREGGGLRHVSIHGRARARVCGGAAAWMLECMLECMDAGPRPRSGAGARVRRSLAARQPPATDRFADSTFRPTQVWTKAAGQSRWSKSLVKVAGQSRWSKSLVKAAGQSRWSKSLAKVAGQSRWSKSRVKVAGQSRGSSPQVSSVGKTGQTRCGFG